MSQFDWQEQLKKIRIDTRPEDLERPQPARSTTGQHLQNDCYAKPLAVAPVPQEQESGDQEAEPLTDQEVFESAVRDIKSQRMAILSKYDREGPDNVRAAAETASGPVAQDHAEKRKKGEANPQDPGFLTANDKNLFLEAVAGVDQGAWHRAKTHAANTESGLRSREKEPPAVDPQDAGPVELDLFAMPPQPQAMELLEGCLERHARRNKKRLTVRYRTEIHSAVQDALLKSRWAGDFHRTPGRAPGEEWVDVALVQHFS